LSLRIHLRAHCGWTAPQLARTEQNRGASGSLGSGQVTAVDSTLTLITGQGPFVLFQLLFILNSFLSGALLHTNTLACPVDFFNSLKRAWPRESHSECWGEWNWNWDWD